VLLSDVGLTAVSQSPPPPPLADRGRGVQGGETRDEDGPLAKIAQRAGRTLDEVQQVYRLDGDKLDVVVSSRLIEPSDAKGSRELTLLVAGGRQAAELEDWTPLSHAREVCRDFGRLDSNNYAHAITKMDAFSFSGKGADRQVRVNRPGWDAWAGLVERLAQSES
jgi:hypothetical protein